MSLYTLVFESLLFGTRPFKRISTKTFDLEMCLRRLTKLSVTQTGGQVSRSRSETVR